MPSRTLCIANFGLIIALSCKADPPALEQGGADAGRSDAGSHRGVGPAPCANHSACSDDVFCNGQELCEPEADNADERGCTPARAEACLPSQECDERADACLSDCAQNADTDGDGHDAQNCSGRDCDDADP